jgi:hypothetical protein
VQEGCVGGRLICHGASRHMGTGVGGMHSRGAGTGRAALGRTENCCDTRYAVAVPILSGDTRNSGVMLKLTKNNYL